MRRRPSVLLAPLVLLASCGGGGAPAAPRSPAERVILVTCDTLRADHLGAYGCDRGLTPNLDDLAAQSRVYTEAYACAPLTGPALASLLTGKLPHEVGVAAGNRSLMPAEVFTLAEALSEKGIPTAAVVSNYVLRRQPGAEGEVGVEQGFGHFDDRMSEREPNRPIYERRASDTTEAAIAWLDGALAREERRFFLWVHYQDPHGPYTPPAPYAERFARSAAGDVSLPIGRDHKSKGQLPSYQVLDGQRDPEPYRGKYDGEVAAFDASLGQLLEHLRETDLLEDALLVFSADHGESMGEHDHWFGHGEHLHREVVRVPLLVRLPGGARAGRSDVMASHLDLFPTTLRALGVDPGPTHGTSLLEADPAGQRVVLSSLGAVGRAGRLESISDGRWRMLVGARGRARLYDLQADPGERANVAADHPAELRRLQEAAVALAEGAGPPLPGVPRRMGAADERAFDDMGYGGGDEGDDDE